MGIVHICQVVSFEIPGLFTAAKAEEYYKKVIKDSLAYICAHPQYVVSLCFTGDLLSWLEQFHQEVFLVLSELSQNHQIECISSGYTNPLFPLLLPVDRSGQIDKQTTLLRKITGKRSRGLKMACDCWEQSLIPSFKTAGVEYVLLKNDLFIKNFQKQLDGFRPHLVEECGKSLILVPYTTMADIGDWLQSSYSQLTAQPYDTLFSQLLSGEQFIRNVKDGICDRLFDWCAGQPQADLNTPAVVTRLTSGFIKTYVPPVWNGNARHVREVINTNTSIRQLYARMIQLSGEVNQFRGDKTRKNAAREELWKAQNYQMYCGIEGDELEQFAQQQAAYRHILAAEKIMGDLSGTPATSITSFDFDFDGLDEYACHFTEYNAYIRLQGASLFELDSRNSCQMYTLCSSPGESLPQRTVFNDFLLDDESFSAFQNCNYPYTRTSHDIHFEVASFQRSKREIVFLGKGRFGKKKLPYSLKKRYVFSDNGVQVTYILKNESQSTLKGHFLVENTLAVPYRETDKREIAVVSNDVMVKPVTGQVFWKNRDVSTVQITDTVTETSFILETNENASLQIQPLFFEKECVASTCGFFWDFDLPGQYETEKTLFLTIRTPTKASLGKKRGRRKTS
ncbi:MAG: DUF1926 domain-containing protein [Treponemataceae bacterium]|nr:DUF1926 domain-containing protein [Treponemataceae bacterium]